MSKVVFDTVGAFSAMCRGGGERASVTVTFNYDLPGRDLVGLVAKLMEVKMFRRFEVGHFEIRNGHISDYNKNGGSGGGKLVDDLDQFEKDINNSLKLDRIWKINEYLAYRQLDASSVGAEVLPHLCRCNGPARSSVSVRTSSSCCRWTTVCASC
jgi:hypothetical protein